MLLKKALEAYSGEMETGLRAAIYHYGQVDALSIMDVYHSDNRAPYARLHDPAKKGPPFYGFMTAANVDLLILMARHKDYGAVVESDEWWPHDNRSLYLDRAGRPLTKADRYTWELHTLLALHKELIGYLSTGPVYCLQHAIEVLSGTALTHLTFYHKGQPGGFLSRERAREVLLPSSYYCSRCGNLLPTLEEPCIPCSLCGRISHKPKLYEAATQRYGNVMLWLCEQCSAEYPIEENQHSE